MRKYVIQCIMEEMAYKYEGKRYVLEALSDEELLNLYVIAHS